MEYNTSDDSSAIMKNMENIGCVIKKSGTKKIGKTSKKRDWIHNGLLEELHSVAHYHQPAAAHPHPYFLPARGFCLELVTGGRGWVEIDGNWEEVTAGALLWNGPGTQTIGRSDFENPYNCLSVRFTADPSIAEIAPRLTRWEEIDEARRFTREMVRLYADGSFDPGLILHYVVSRLHFQAMLHVHAQARHGLPVELSRVVDLLDLHYAEPLRLGKLAREAGWSVAHLHDRFKEHLGMTPHQALIRRRIQAAREILVSTHDPIKSVASQCGFSTTTAFCVQFKKTMQFSPKEYRRRQLYGQRDTVSKTAAPARSAQSSAVQRRKNGAEKSPPDCSCQSGW
jgi:AraC-like DNA-binding protein